MVPGKDRTIRTHLGIAGAEGDDESIAIMPAPRAAARRSGRREIASAVCASVIDFGETVDLKQELTARLLSASPTQPALKSVISAAAKGEAVPDS